jgi:hypothetical protein
MNMAGKKTLNAVRMSLSGSITLGNDVLFNKAPARTIEVAPLFPAVVTNSNINIPARRCKKYSVP